METHTDLFRCYVPQQLQRTFGEWSAPLARPLRQSAQGAVLFFDISGFTSLCERFAHRGPAGLEALSTLLNAYFGTLVSTIAEHGGDIISFAGDAMLAAWYSPSLQQAALRAARCGLALQARNADVAATTPEKLSLKVAVDVGEISLTYTGGVRNRWEYFIGGSALKGLFGQEQHLQKDRVLLAPGAWECMKQQARVQRLASGWLQLVSLEGAPSPERLRAPELSPEAAQVLKGFVPAGIRSRIEAGQNDWLAELRQITVLFLNLPEVGIHTPLEQAQNVVEAIQRAVYRFEGSISQFSVDEKGVMVVAVFGLPPLSHEDDPLRGALAGLAVHEAVLGQGVDCSIGIATGRVFSGTLGSSERRMYALIGDTMNLAARLMKAGANDILCDEATHAGAVARLDFEALPPRTVKGKAAPVAIYRPLGRGHAALPRQSSVALIGRARERRLLEQCLVRLEEKREGGLVLLEGEAGIGKSRLVSEFLEKAKRLGITPLVGAGDAIEKHTPWFAWRPVVSGLLGAEGVQALARGEPGHFGLKPGKEHFASLLGVFLSMDIPETEITAQVTGQARNDTTKEMVVDMLAARAASGPLVVVLEDAHWFDSASWKLVAAVLRDVSPLLLVVTLRPDGGSALPEVQTVLGNPDALKLTLEGLGDDELLELARRRLGVTSLPEPLAALIRDKAAGNPFFGEELVSELLEARAIAVEGGACRLLTPDLQALSTPDTLQGLITSRIDRTPPKLQLTLKVASVIGRLFEPQTLSAIYPVEEDKPRLGNQLQQIESLGFTTLDAPPPHLRYLFKHVMTRDVAYNLMLFAQRRSLHQLLAEWIESRHQDELEQFLPLLAHHWTMADDKPKAVAYLIRAARHALDSDANLEVLTFLDEVDRLEEQAGLAPSVEEQTPRLCMRAEAQMRLGRHGTAIQYYEQVLGMLGSPVPSSALTTGLRLLGELAAHVLGRWRRRRAPSSLARQRLLQSASVRNHLIKMYFFAGETLKGLHSMLRQLNDAQRAGPSPELANSLTSASALFCTMGLYGLGRTYYEAAEQLVGTLEDLSTLGYVKHVLNFFHFFQADWEPSLGLLAQSLAAYERLGAMQTELALHPLLQLGLVQLHVGRLEESAQTLERVALAGRRSANTHAQMQAQVLMAEVERRRENWGEAERGAERALEFIGEQQFPSERLLALSVLALARQRAGRSAEAHEAAKACIPLLKFSPGMPYTMHLGLTNTADYCLADLGVGERGNGQSAEALARALKALKGFTKIFRFGQPLALRCSARRERMLGHGEAAGRLARQSVEAARGLSMPYEQAQGLLELSECTHEAELRGRYLSEAAGILSALGVGSQPVANQPASESRLMAAS